MLQIGEYTNGEYTNNFNINNASNTLTYQVNSHYIVRKTKKMRKYPFSIQKPSPNLTKLLLSLTKVPTHICFFLTLLTNINENINQHLSWNYAHFCMLSALFCWIRY